MISKQFISTSNDYSTLETMVPAPYLRRTFILKDAVKSGSLQICGLGFYELWVNGEKITKGHLAPYISNPDDLLYYDTYDIAEHLRQGENVIGVQLGNGMQNCPGGEIWDFHKAPWRSAPKLAIEAEIQLENADVLTIVADETFRCHDSPVYFDDLRAGEYYDATKEVPGWNQPGFEDSAWTAAMPVEAPRGTFVLSEAEPIRPQRELKPMEVRQSHISHQPDVRKCLPVVPMEGVEAQTEGWLYDFGVNAAGLCRLKINGKPGQKIVLQFCEALAEDGGLDMRGMSFLPIARNHRDVYVCKGGGEETWMPSFTYHGFRYVLVLGLEDEQAQDDLLGYVVMNSDFQEVGGFECSDSVINALEEATKVSDLANFYYFPADCPHREKNGWTADAALSAEHMLFNFSVEKSFQEWLRNIRCAQRADGALPGIIPTSGWGFSWGNGPAWDSVIIWLPYYVWLYRGDVTIVEENATAMMRYLNYVSTRRDQDGILHFGLGDWCHVNGNRPKAPLELTDTVITIDLCRKAAVLFKAVGLNVQAEFAERLGQELKQDARTHLLDIPTMTAYGRCQTSQALAIFFDVFTDAEKQGAFDVLVRLIEQNDGLMDVGVLGGRVIFHVLSDFGRTDLAYDMIRCGEFPSYAYWIEKQDATSLFEDFLPIGSKPNSRNHHFWGDISSWFKRCLAGIRVNPFERDCNELQITPHPVDALDHASAWHRLPAGKVCSEWHRDGDDIVLVLTIPEGAKGTIVLPEGWTFEDGRCITKAETGEYRMIQRKKQTS